NLIKAIFGVNYLSQIHASLNNIDKLRRLVSKVQKIHHPFGQGLLKYFEIDLSFKRVSGEINEFEINCYNKKCEL
ncbi:15000_t:CDS:2, partial [Cetraspora pellucida]